MATEFKGSITQNVKKMAFGISVTVTSEPSNLRYKVHTEALLRNYNHVWWSVGEKDTVTFAVGGTTTKVTKNGWSCMNMNQLYTLATNTTYFPYSAAKRTISVACDTTRIDGIVHPSGSTGEIGSTMLGMLFTGPGKCSANGTISLAAVYSTTGTLSVPSKTEDSVTIKLTADELKKKKYARRVIWKYKLSTESSYKNAGTVTVAADAGSGSLSKTITGLIPGRTYNFQAVVQTVTNSVTITTKSVSATTSAAAGTLALSSVGSNGMTATVSGMKSTEPYVRYVKFYYKKSTASTWTLAATKTIAANAAAGSPSYAFKNLVAGTKYNVRATFTGQSIVYKTTNTATCTLPYEGVCIPTVLSVTQTAPSPQITITWKLAKVVAGSLDTSSFEVYIERASGTAIKVETKNGSSISPSTATVTTVYNASWLKGKETITVYVKAINTQAKGPAFSDDYKKSVWRYFYWNSDKLRGEAFGITAAEFNSLKAYINAAAELYPGKFAPITIEDVSSADAFTHAIAAAVSYGSDVDMYDQVLASDAMALQAAINKKIT